MSLPMPTGIEATDWISAIATAFACLASFILAIIALRQAGISEKQTKILRDHAEIFSRQAYYQGQQTTISKQQAAIMDTQTVIAGQQCDILVYQEQERRKDRLQARFEARTIRKGIGDRIPTTYLQIENKGPADARDIEMSLIDMISERPATLHHQIPPSLPYFPSGSILNFLLIACQGDPPYCCLKINWNDGLDERHSEKIPFGTY
jgi:hypothetical protein